MHTIPAPVPSGPFKLCALAALGFAMCAAMLAMGRQAANGVPDMAALTAAHGQITTISTERRAVKFALQGRAEPFVYWSQAGDFSHVQAALYAARDSASDVAVLFAPGAARTRAGHIVWELAVDGGAVRMTAEIAEAYRNQSLLAYWLAAAFALADGHFSLLAARALRARRRL